MRRGIFAGCLLVVMGIVCLTLQGQQTPASEAEMFAGKDPLAGAEAGTPLPTSGPCVAPRNSNWTLVGQDKINCYWYAPYPQRLNGYVTSINNVAAVEKAGGRCGVDGFDATQAICQNAGDQFAGATPTKGLPADVGTGGQPGGSLPSTGYYRRQIPPPALDPCHPNYDMSTASGRAAPQQNAARDRQSCNDERCQHNPTLPFCGGPPSIAAPAPEPGGKGLGRTDDELTVPPPPPLGPPPVPPKNLGLFPYANAMSKCLQASLPENWPAMILRNQYVKMAMAGTQPANVRPAQATIFLQERAMALQAQAYYDQRFGPNPFRGGNNAAGNQAFLTGWLDQCLKDAGLELPLDNSLASAYAAYLGVSLGDEAAQMWASAHGWGEAVPSSDGHTKPVSGPPSLVPPGSQLLPQYR